MGGMPMALPLLYGKTETIRHLSEQALHIPPVGAGAQGPAQMMRDCLFFHGVLTSLLTIYFDQFSRFNSILRDFRPKSGRSPLFFPDFWLGGQKMQLA